MRRLLLGADPFVVLMVFRANAVVGLAKTKQLKVRRFLHY